MTLTSKDRFPWPENVPIRALCVLASDYHDTGWRWYLWAETIGRTDQRQYLAFPVHRSGETGDLISATDKEAARDKIRLVSSVSRRELRVWPWEPPEPLPINSPPQVADVVPF